MIILSLFDGISCGQFALNKLGKRVSRYYSSEIDSHAMDVTSSNYPETIFLGDVTKVDEAILSGLGNVDIIFAGFPCQNISSAGDRKGLEGDKSSLFFHFYRILQYFKKKNKDILFLVENVGGIKKEDLDLINNLLGVDSIILNSQNYSPQRRVRHYWSNIDFENDECSINTECLGDIIETQGQFDEFILPDKLIDVYSLLEDGQYWKHLPDGHPEKMHIEAGRSRHKSPGGQTGFWKLSDKTLKSQTLMATGMKQKMTRFVIRDYGGIIRYPTPVEFERLQGLPDGYTSSISNSKRYFSIGNGWSVNTVMDILKSI